MKSRKIAVLALALFVFVIPLITFAADGWDINNISGLGLPSATIGDILKAMVKNTLYLFGFFGILGFATAGIFYLISGGDEDMAKKAKKAMTTSLAGVAIGLAGLVIIKAIELLLKATTITP